MFTQYHAQWSGFRQGAAGQPLWARILLGIAAAPGLVLLLLSAVVAGVSILALLMLVGPTYFLVRSIRSIGSRGDEQLNRAGGASEAGLGVRRKHVQVVVTDASVSRQS